ncbi:helicase-associated domain-containing protein [Microbacterium halophytorum]|uniref:helicase-associated domain-containing protein n=1 Tax=Microbacterium halophytorum TaxID=2067568 RepID=UPI000CFB7074|nr:helicase-associated domain-containing protein [Microbacterium halophytorum]
MPTSAEPRIRSLAERLAAAEDAELSRLFAERGVSRSAPWHDWFDAADALLAPESIAKSVSALPRDALAALASGASDCAPLGLVDAAGRPFAPVLEAVPSDLLPPRPSTPPAASDDASAHAAERAFTAMSAMADILIEGLRTPLPRVGGRLGANERRRLAQDGVVASAEDADLITAAAEAAGLMRGDDRRWLVTRAGADWTSSATPERWSALAEGLRAALPDGLRDGGGWVDPSAWPDAYPLLDTWPEDAERWREMFELAGLIAADGEPPWAAPLRQGRRADPSGLLALLPHEVDQVFLQNDLTAISPGTLAPPLDMRLRSIAVRESHAQASSYRFTQASVSAGLAAGETAASIREFLGGISLTGVPQPLEYLVERTAQRHGLVRVSLDPSTGHSVVSSPDHHLLETISVDQSVRALGLVADGALLRTRADRRAVYWGLLDARYPVVAIDDDGAVVTMSRDRVAPDDDADDDRYAALIARLRAAESGDADAAWLERELGAAVKDKASLVVAVAMPDGSTRELTLEATGLGGGRLRGLDRGADVERTLPVKSIAAVRRA